MTFVGVSIWTSVRHCFLYLLTTSLASSLALRSFLKALYFATLVSITLGQIIVSPCILFSPPPSSLGILCVTFLDISAF